MASDSFTFKQFVVRQELCGMKVGTDGVLLGAWAEGGRSILDIGTGTGLVAMMMAQRFPESRVKAIDMDVDACRQASANVSASRFADRVEVECCRLQDFFPTCQYDCVVSNPPYYDNTLICPDGKRTVARHTDTLPFAVLVRCLDRLMSPDGRFSVVLPTECYAHFIKECSAVGLVETRRCTVRTVPRKAPRRVLLTFARTLVGSADSSEEILTDAYDRRSAWYSGLTKDFYIK